MCAKETGYKARIQVYYVDDDGGGYNNDLERKRLYVCISVGDVRILAVFTSRDIKLHVASQRSAATWVDFHPADDEGTRHVDKTSSAAANDNDVVVIAVTVAFVIVTAASGATPTRPKWL